MNHCVIVNLLSVACTSKKGIPEPVPDSFPESLRTSPLFGFRVNRFADSRARFSRIVSGFPDRTPFLRIAFKGGIKLRIAGLRRFARIARTL